MNAILFISRAWAGAAGCFLLLCFWMYLRWHIPAFQSALNRADRWQHRYFRQRKILALRASAIRRVGQVTGIQGAIRRAERERSVVEHKSESFSLREYTQEFFERNGLLLARVVFTFCALQLLRAFVS